MSIAIANNRRKRLERNPQSLEAVEAQIAALEAFLPQMPAAIREYLDTLRAWVKARRDRYILENTGLAGQLIHNQYRALLGAAKIDPDDAFQYGILGLERAAMMFDESRGISFSTYAWQWIAQYLLRAASASGLIHVPCHLLSEKQAAKAQRGYAACQEAAQRARVVSSLSAPVVGRYEYPTTTGALLDDPKCERHEERVDARIDVLQLLDCLFPVQKQVIKMRFFENLKLAEIANRLEPKITRERVRQIEAKALDRMRRWAEELRARIA